MIMTWKALTHDGAKLLYVYDSFTKKMIPYTQSIHKKPDYTTPKGSRGYSTMQYLLKQGWRIVPSKDVDECIKELNDKPN